MNDGQSIGQLVVYVPRGRQSSFSQAVADRICERMIEGEGLVEICADPDMPHRATVYRWMDEFADFATRCARAREGLADVMDQKIMAVAEACTVETFQADKVKISAYQWRAAKLNPKRYGEKLDVSNSGQVLIATIEIPNDPIEAARVYQKMLKGE